MDQSSVFGRNVRTPLFGVMLGIFVLIHSGFSNVVSQDDVYREAVTEGYLIDGFFLSPRSTALPRGPETAEPSSQSNDGDVFEERSDDSHNVSTTQSGSGTQNPNLKTTEISPFEGSGDTTDLVLTTTEISPSKGSGDTRDLVLTTTEISPFEGSGDTWDQVLTTTEISPSKGSGDTRDLVLTTTEISPFEGSGDTMDQVLTTTESSPTEGSGDLVFTTMESSTTAVLQDDIEGSASGSLSLASTSVSLVSTPNLKLDVPPPVMDNDPLLKKVVQPAETKSPQPGKAHESSGAQTDRTPGWIIIVAFIVGVAALVMLCVAIATKDKWNGPNQATQLENKTNSSNQQRELEMETFLQKDHPRENGEAEEYTVIQLDDLPEKYSSD